MLLTFVWMAARTREPMGPYFDAGMVASILPGFTVGQIRSAAAGDGRLSQDLCRQLQNVADLRGGAPRWARLSISAIEGYGLRIRNWEVGWPVRWFDVARYDSYANIRTLGTPLLDKRGIQQGWRWDGGDGWTGYWVMADGGSALVDFRLGSLAAQLLIVAAAWFAGSKALRRRCRSRLIWIMAAVAATIGSLAIIGWFERLEARYPQSSFPPERTIGTLADVRDSLSRPESQIEVARQVAAGLDQDDERAQVNVVWRSDSQPVSRGTSFGWPLRWVIWGTAALQPPRSNFDMTARGFTRMQDIVGWQDVGQDGRAQGVQVFIGGVGASFTPIAAAFFVPLILYRLTSGRRLRRWQHEGRCFHCGYEVGLQPVREATA